MTENSNRADLDRKTMTAAAAKKVWTIPAHEGRGPVTLKVEIPFARITDSDGRHIIVSPKQLEIVGARISELATWLQYGDADYIEPHDA
jgi:hypothetical protein